MLKLVLWVFMVPWVIIFGLLPAPSYIGRNEACIANLPNNSHKTCRDLVEWKIPLFSGGFRFHYRASYPPKGYRWVYTTKFIVLLISSVGVGYLYFKNEDNKTKARIRKQHNP
jgi:hypothetical protein